MNADRHDGFTLIELLVALVVVVVALAAVQRTTLQAVANTEAMQIATFAHWVAKDQLNSLRMNDAWPPPGKRQDVVRFAEQEWRWTREVRNSDDPRLRVIEVSVRLANDPRDSTRARLTTYLLEPSSTASTSPGGAARR